MTNSVGRPELEIDWKTLDVGLQYGASLIDCSEFLGVSEDTIQRKIKDNFGVTFSEYREKKKSKMRMKLRQKQFEVALSGNVVMLKWLGQNELGQTDKSESEVTTREIKVNYAYGEKDEDNSNFKPLE